MIISIVTTATASFAQTSEKKVPDLPTTSSAAIELAVQNRTEIRMEDVQVAIKEIGIKKAAGAFFPTLDFAVQAKRTTLYDRFTGTTVSVNIGGQRFAADVQQSVLPYEINSELAFTYNLFAGGRDAAKLEEAYANKAIAEYQKKVTLRKIILDVSTAYWELRKAQIAYAIAERWRGHYSNCLKITEAQLNAGQSSELEKQLADLRFSEQEIAASQAERELRQELKNYQRALGLKEDGDADGIRHVPPLRDDPEQDVPLLATEPQQRPELLQLEADVRRARAHMKSERAEFFPKLDFIAGYYDAGRNQDSVHYAYDDFHRNNYYIGVQLTVNLFDGFRTAQKNAEAVLETHLARIRLEQKERELSSLLFEKIKNVDKAQEELTLARKRLTVSEAKKKIAEVQRRIGKYSEQEYQKEDITFQEDSDRFLLAKIDLMMARLDLSFARL